METSKLIQRLTIIAAVCLAAVHASGQTLPLIRPHTKKSGDSAKFVNYLIVKDANGRFIPNLTAANFAATVGGRPATNLDVVPLIDRARLGYIFVVDIDDRLASGQVCKNILADLENLVDANRQYRGAVIYPGAPTPTLEGAAAFGKKLNKIIYGDQRNELGNLTEMLVAAQTVPSPPEMQVAVVAVTNRNQQGIPDSYATQLVNGGRPIYVVNVSGEKLTAGFSDRISATSGRVLERRDFRSLEKIVTSQLVTEYGISFSATPDEAHSPPEITLTLNRDGETITWKYTPPPPPLHWWIVLACTGFLVIAAVIVARRNPHTVRELIRRVTTRQQKIDDDLLDTGDKIQVGANNMESPAHRKTKKQELTAEEPEVPLAARTGYVLSVTDGPRKGVELELTEEAATVGCVSRLKAAPASFLDLTGDDYVSAAHARIEWRPDIGPGGAPAHVLVHTSETNKTYLNGRVVSPERMIKAGDKIRLGHSEIYVHAKGAGVPSEGAALKHSETAERVRSEVL